MSVTDLNNNIGFTNFLKEKGLNLFVKDIIILESKNDVQTSQLPFFADGYPGIKGIGKKGAAQLLNQYGPIEKFPEKILKAERAQALLFKRLATLRLDAELFKNVDELKWNGPTSSFTKLMKKMDEPRLLTRAESLAAKIE